MMTVKMPYRHLNRNVAPIWHIKRAGSNLPFQMLVTMQKIQQVLFRQLDEGMKLGIPPFQIENNHLPLLERPQCSSVICN